MVLPVQQGLVPPAPGMMPPDPTMMQAPPSMAPPPGPSSGDLYELMIQVQEQLEDEWNKKHEPMYPPWYDPDYYPKPEPGRTAERAGILESEFARLRQRIYTDYQILQMDVSGVFKDFRADTHDAWKDPGIAGEFEQIAAELADSEVHWDAPARNRSEEDESAKKIDFAYACEADARRKHSRLGGGPYRIEKARALLATGRICFHTMVDLDADVDEMPFKDRLIDPATAMPVYDAHGLCEFYRTYYTSLEEAVSDFSTKDNDLRDRYFSDRSKTGQFQKKRDKGEIVKVTLMFDRRWRQVLIEDAEALTVEHKYGRVPVVYKMGGIGIPSYLTNPEDATRQDIPGFTYLSSYSARDVAHPNKGVGLASLLRVPHQLREAILTRVMTAFAKSVNPPMTLEMDDLTYSKGVPRMSSEPNAVNPLRLNRHRLGAFPFAPDMSIAGALMGAVDDGRSRMMLPAMAHGSNDHSNVAGYATNVLNTAGLKKIVGHKQAMEEFEADCMELRFALFRDFGHLLRQGREGTYGELNVPRSDPMPDEDQTFTLKPGDLRRTGIKVVASMSNMSIYNLGPVVNAASQLTAMGVWDELDVHKAIGTPNPHKAMARIRMNKFLNAPELTFAQGIKALVEAGMVGEAAYMLHARGMGNGGGGGAMMEGSMGMSGQPPSPVGSPVQSVVGDSNAQVGFGPGPGSGPSGPMLPPSDPYGTEP